MGFASTEDSVMDDADCGGVKSSSCGSVPCSICLEIVADNGDRSWAKLQCGHQFHLDCIGSAFNAKGAMQCPNCRKIEKGQWLYTNGSRSYPEFSIWDDWNHDEDHYDASYSEMSFGVHWCPFGQLARFPSVFEDGEFSSSTYHDMLGQPAILTEHAAVPAATHPCPYFAFFGPVHPSTNSNGSAPDSSNFISHWNGPTIANEMPTSYAFPMDVNYHGWEHHCPSYLTSSSNVGAADQHPVPPIPQASVWATSDMSRSGPYVQPPVVGQSSGRRAGSSVASSMVPPYPGSNARNRDRVQALQAYYQQQATDSPAIQNPTVSHTRRSNGHRGVAQMGSVSSTDQSGGFFVFQSTPGRSFLEGEIPLSTRLAWDRDLLPSSTFSSNQVDRDPNWGSFHQSLPLPNPDTRYTSYTGFRQRHGP